ncbi:MAG TPA: hypothetical protein PK718_03460 [Candidatus Methanofastidiosa archaeon]|nr:hypothetical protein [Candidatus Methanofastidiosa archaeon]HPR41588.1 hypothetical protein [Candidatus Methanofastidiosa archaeon]
MDNAKLTNALLKLHILHSAKRECIDPKKIVGELSSIYGDVCASDIMDVILWLKEGEFIACPPKSDGYTITNKGEKMLNRALDAFQAMMGDILSMGPEND